MKEGKIVEQQKVQWSMVFVIVLCAAIAIVFGRIVNPHTPWFLYIVLVSVGFFIHTLILVIKTDDDQEATDTLLKKKA